MRQIQNTNRKQDHSKNQPQTTGAQKEKHVVIGGPVGRTGQKTQLKPATSPSKTTRRDRYHYSQPAQEAFAIHSKLSNKPYSSSFGSGLNGGRSILGVSFPFMRTSADRTSRP